MQRFAGMEGLAEKPGSHAALGTSINGIVLGLLELGPRRSHGSFRGPVQMSVIDLVIGLLKAMLC